MKTVDWLFSILEAILWYGFIYLFIFTIKNPVNLWLNSFILLILLYVASISCPWFRNTDAWKKLWKK
ncbi:MAG: hypothetical protein ABIA74_01270 [bacterium]